MLVDEPAATLSLTEMPKALEAISSSQPYGGGQILKFAPQVKAREASANSTLIMRFTVVQLLSGCNSPVPLNGRSRTLRSELISLVLPRSPPAQIVC